MNNEMIIAEKEQNVSVVVPIDQKSDAELCNLASQNYFPAFEELYHRHHRRVYSICLRMLQNSTEAEDLTQDVFIQLHRKVGSFQGDAAFTTWLHRLTVNQVLMHSRKRNVKFEKTTDDEETSVIVVTTSNQGNTMPVVDQVTMDAAIAKLPTGYRNVFVLHDIEGYEHVEVARILGCSVGTSKSQLHKARLKLRKILDKEKS